MLCWQKRQAKIIAFVKNDQDVSLAVRYAQEASLPLAIRGGGHNPAGSSSSEGIVIDLSRYMNECRIEAKDKLTYVGGGTLWKTVDEAAIKHGLATVGGTVNHVSVYNTSYIVNNAKPEIKTGVGGLDLFQI